MRNKIIGVTVGTPISPEGMRIKMNAVKTVNGIEPDENGNVKVVVPNGGASVEEAAQIQQNKENIAKLNTDKLDASKLPEAINDALEQANASGEFNGKDGYTPVKGKDYFDGEPGYTPQKGVDYFDGEPGKTPVKGEDYFTPEEVQAIAEQAAEMVDIPSGGTMQPLTFTGAVNATYDGSVPVSVEIPQGGGGGSGGGSGFSLPLLYETTTTEEVRWIDTGDNAFEAKNMIIVDLLSKATASNTETKGICASIYTEKSKPIYPYSNYGLTSGIANMLSGQNDMRARLVGFRGNSGNWTVFYTGRSEANDGGFSPYIRLSGSALVALPIKGLIIGDEAAKAGTRVFGIGTTLKIWGC